MSKIAKVFRFRSGRFLPVVIITGAALVLIASNIVMTLTIRATDVNTFVRSDAYVPKEIPLNLETLTLYGTIGDEYQFRFVAANTTIELLSNLKFLVFVVGENGDVKFDQGWTHRGGLKSLAKSEFEVRLKYRVSNGDRLVLTVYSVAGKSGENAVAPEKVVSELSSKGLIRSRGNIKSHLNKANSLAKSRQIDAKFTVDDNCAAALTAASLACPCGLKSFSCDPATGAFSFMCFSQQENPGLCPESPPGN